jgi:excinuclease UvrABC ATPase subunit
MEYGFNLDVKWENLDEELKNIILYGDGELLKLNM